MITSDKKLHFIASASIVLALWQIVKWWSIPIAVLFGIGKELYDIKTTGFDVKDILFDCYGIIAATLFECALKVLQL